METCVMLLGMPLVGDAFGAMLRYHFEVGSCIEILERDDGFVSAVQSNVYFADFSSWTGLDRLAVSGCVGRTLDVGAGAGRVSLELQRRNLDVLALDTSPGAIEVSRRRGVHQTFTGSIYELSDDIELFDTIVLMGNNLGLFESAEDAKPFLGRMADLAKTNGTVIATGTDPYDTHDPVHLKYHRRNRSMGRLGGQLYERVRFREIATPWFNYLLLAPHELAQVVEGSNWDLTKIERRGCHYLAILSRH